MEDRMQALPGEGVSADQLPDIDLLRELAELHRTRSATLRHASAQALTRHTERTAELEAEYLRRFPEREVDPERLRAGARERGGAVVRPVEESVQAGLAADDEAPLPGLVSGGERSGGVEFLEPG